MLQPQSRNALVTDAQNARLFIYVFIRQNGSIKNTYMQKYTINKNESRNKEK